MSELPQVWTSKYHPDTLDDVAGHETVVRRMKEYVEDPSMPNIMLSGPQGTGKTTICQAFAKDKYGDDWRANFRQFNASDDRGIKVVRGPIKDYAEQAVMGGHDYKIIFLDEADSLSKDAMAALRRVMEDYVEDTRFFLSCNYPSEIIDPIQSRCAAWRVSSLDDGEVKRTIKNVAIEEDLDYEEDTLMEIASKSDGDIRKAITNLQASTSNGVVDVDFAGSLIGYVDEGKIEEVVNLSVGDRLDDAHEELDGLLKDGMSSGELADGFYSVIRSKEWSGDIKAKMLDYLADAEYNSAHGSNPHIQWHAFLSKLHRARHIQLDNYRKEGEV